MCCGLGEQVGCHGASVPLPVPTQGWHLCFPSENLSKIPPLCFAPPHGAGGHPAGTGCCPVSFRPGVPLGTQTSTPQGSKGTLPDAGTSTMGSWWSICLGFPTALGRSPVLTAVPGPHCPCHLALVTVGSFLWPPLPRACSPSCPCPFSETSLSTPWCQPFIPNGGEPQIQMAPRPTLPAT